MAAATTSHVRPQVSEFPDHSGSKPPVALNYFAAPPAEMGAVLSAESTLKAGRRPLTFLGRLGIAVGIGVVVLGVGLYLCSDSRRSERDVYQGGTVLVSILSVIFGFILLPAAPRCNYVGENGIAEFILRGRGSGPPRFKVLLFERADALYASQTHQYLKGVYVSTNYVYYWIDPSGKKLLSFKGSHRDKQNRSRLGTPFAFVRAAEAAWSWHYLRRAEASLQAEGSIPFQIDSHRWIRVGHGFLVHFGGSPVRVTKDEIASVTLNAGNFAFKHKDAKWYSRAGKYQFSYGAMANARVFLLALDRLMGYRWE